MTGQMVFERACSYLMEKPGDDRAFSEHALTIINQLITEALPYQNSRNRARGEAEKESITIAKLSDEIELDAAISERALPMGLASEFFRDEEDTHQAELLRARFEKVLESAKMYREDSISDLYGGEE